MPLKKSGEGHRIESAVGNQQRRLFVPAGLSFAVVDFLYHPEAAFWAGNDRAAIATYTAMLDRIARDPSPGYLSRIADLLHETSLNKSTVPIAQHPRTRRTQPQAGEQGPTMNRPSLVQRLR